MPKPFQRVYRAKDGTIRRTKTWFVKITQNKRVKIVKLGTTKISAANRAADRIGGDVANGKTINPERDKITFDEAMDRVLVRYSNNKLKSRDHAQRRITLHLQPFFGGRLMRTITTADIERYKKARLEAKPKGASNASVNLELSLLKLGWRLAELPRENRPALEKLKENNVRTGFFERDVFERVREQLPEPLKALATFFYLTGWRKSEVLSLRWDQIDFVAGTITLDVGTTKSGAGRVFPFAAIDELRTLLETQRKLPFVTRFVFHRDGTQITSYDTAWKSACKRAGVPNAIVHDFRRTAVRNLVRAGVPEAVAMKLTGHKTRSVFERYNIVSGDDLREAALKLNVALKNAQVSDRVSVG